MNVKVGNKFTATIDGDTVEDGTIQIQDGLVYLCQNVCDGDGCKDKLGYKYSWYVCNVEKFNETALLKEHVKNFQLLPNRKERIEKLEL